MSAPRNSPGRRFNSEDFFAPTGEADEDFEELTQAQEAAELTFRIELTIAASPATLPAISTEVAATIASILYLHGKDR
jgi:hypothetical protein